MARLDWIKKRQRRNLRQVPNPQIPISYLLQVPFQRTVPKPQLRPRMQEPCNQVGCKRRQIRREVGARRDGLVDSAPGTLMRWKQGRMWIERRLK